VLGVEDMTATLVNKGQSVDKTTEAFGRLRAAGICPMPMMMHHDTQPLYSRKANYGLLNQIKLLRNAGAVSLQVLMITPSAGTKLYEQTFTSGQVFESVGARRVLPHMYDGNYVVASSHARPLAQAAQPAHRLSLFLQPWCASAQSCCARRRRCRTRRRGCRWSA